MAVKTNLKPYAVGERIIIRATILGETDVTTWAFEFKQAVKGVVITKTSASGITGTAGHPESIDIVLASADTADLIPGTGDWIVRRTDAGSEVRLGYGKVTVEAVPA